MRLQLVLLPIRLIAHLLQRPRLAALAAGFVLYVTNA